MSFAKEAWPFVLPFLLLALLLLVFERRLPAVAALVVGILVLLFFRDPARRYVGPDEVVLAPADGRVTAKPMR